MARRNSRIGRYVETAHGGETIRAYVPPPLPPTPPLVLDGLLSRLSAADQAIGRLDGISVLLPNKELFLYMYVRKEAVLSSQIEGTQSTLSDLTGSADALWLGTFAREPGAKLFKIPFERLRSPIRAEDAAQTVTLPTEAQGAAFDAAGRLWITRSTGRFGELVMLELASGDVSARYAMPAGVEDLSFDEGGALWTLSEAGSKRWIGWSTFFPVIFRLDVAKLRYMTMEMKLLTPAPWGIIP